MILPEPYVDPQLYHRTNEDRYATWKRHHVILTRHWWTVLGFTLALLIGCCSFAWFKLWISAVMMFIGFAASCVDLGRRGRRLAELKKDLDEWRTTLPHLAP